MKWSAPWQFLSEVPNPAQTQHQTYACPSQYSIALIFLTFVAMDRRMANMSILTLVTTLHVQYSNYSVG